MVELKTAEHVALWSFCMPFCTFRCSYVLRTSMASQTALHSISELDSTNFI